MPWAKKIIWNYLTTECFRFRLLFFLSWINLPKFKIENENGLYLPFPPLQCFLFIEDIIYSSRALVEHWNCFRMQKSKKNENGWSYIQELLKLNQHLEGRKIACDAVTPSPLSQAEEGFGNYARISIWFREATKSSFLSPPRLSGHRNFFPCIKKKSFFLRGTRPLRKKLFLRLPLLTSRFL